jgi:hypothetical protein
MYPHVTQFETLELRAHRQLELRRARQRPARRTRPRAWWRRLALRPA